MHQELFLTIFNVMHLLTLRLSDQYLIWLCDKLKIMYNICVSTAMFKVAFIVTS